MSAPLRLILFDVDGTLVDSQATIVAAMRAAFGAAGLETPARSELMSGVGLSLPVLMKALVPEQDDRTVNRLVAGYKEAYHDIRLSQGSAHSPLYPGARALLENLNGSPELLLGVATGKSKRGLDALIEAHGLERMFVTRQVADHHPSKPHPSMIDTARAETGVARDDTIMIGDTSFDMQMASAAGVAGIGVTWGYHHRSALEPARNVVEDFAQLADVLNTFRAVNHG
ncbi:HAD-IA family hydrolase [Ruegeria sp. 2012CJ41-6]|uniref:HAD-IA family hydrolase n=1 Tax=Ruegeria spongiae TaxID=2942209 RepID=A0ABT0Q164_9RHOB|nr:HAD-IA family hydrolase [Ruegeria spongiae]MCL6283589.1 HAD-IA family hydrolase [Ruegeria spongiae]